MPGFSDFRQFLHLCRNCHPFFFTVHTKITSYFSVHWIVQKQILFSAHSHPESEAAMFFLEKSEMSAYQKKVSRTILRRDNTPGTKSGKTEPSALILWNECHRAGRNSGAKPQLKPPPESCFFLVQTSLHCSTPQTPCDFRDPACHGSHHFCFK